MNTQSIGSRIKQLRRDAHMSQISLGQLVEKDGTTIGRYENNSLPIPSDVLIVISNHFEVSADWILTGRTAYMHQVDEHMNANSFECLNLFQKLTDEEQLEIIELLQFKIFKRTGKLSTLQLDEKGKNDVPSSVTKLG